MTHFALTLFWENCNGIGYGLKIAAMCTPCSNIYAGIYTLANTCKMVIRRKSTLRWMEASPTMQYCGFSTKEKYQTEFVVWPYSCENMYQSQRKSWIFCRVLLLTERSVKCIPLDVDAIWISLPELHGNNPHYFIMSADIWQSCAERTRTFTNSTFRFFYSSWCIEN